MKFFALLAVAQAVQLSGPFTAPDQPFDVSANPTVQDRTGTYSPKKNMWTGFEGDKYGNEYTYTYKSTGGHPSLNRVPSKTSNFRNAVNEGSSHQRPN